ncbi:MAG: LVIVD repeat-containing protein [Sporichthyaceae bacterium]
MSLGNRSSLRRSPALRLALALGLVLTPIAAFTIGSSAAAGSGSPLAQAGNGETASTFQGPVPRASCGKGAVPEVGLAGQVPVSERVSGASSAGYRCNLKLVGKYGPEDPQGFEGAEWQMARYGHCAYYSQRLFGGGLPARSSSGLPEFSALPTPPQSRPGTVVVDVSNPRDPKFATNIFTPGMADPWESLKVHQGRGLLVAVNAASAYGGAFMGVYDVSKDCTKPVKLFDGPTSFTNHEGNFAADGMTYYSSGLAPGVISAIDLADPANPRLLATFFTTNVQHGLSTSKDGNRLFLSHINDETILVLADSTGAIPSVAANNGMGIYDISEIQARKANPQVRQISALRWQDGQDGQHTLNVFKGKREYLIHVDEGGHGGARIIDITNEAAPTVISKVKTEIMMAENRDLAKADTQRLPFEKGGVFGFGYNFHYCNVDRVVNPAMLACSAFNQGLRVFDIRNLAKPKEIAYYNPGGDGTLLPGSFGGSYAGYPAAMPQFVPERKEIWITDQDRGLFILRFTNGAWISKVRSSAETSYGN